MHEVMTAMQTNAANPLDKAGQAPLPASILKPSSERRS